MADNVQLDLMEKDIVIEQLRNEVKQLRSRLAVMEEDQAVDTAPLQGLLNQLGELKVRTSHAVVTLGSRITALLIFYYRFVLSTPLTRHNTLRVRISTVKVLSFDSRVATPYFSCSPHSL